MRITDSLPGAMRNGNSFSSSCNVGDAAAHQTLDRVDGAVGFGDQRVARRVADDDLAVARDGDDARDEADRRRRRG